MESSAESSQSLALSLPFSAAGLHADRPRTYLPILPSSSLGVPSHVAIPKSLRAFHSIATAAALVALAGCADPTAPEPLDPCTGAVTVSVTAGTTPRISWSPACNVIFMIVEEDAADLWMVLANADAGFGPGIDYGTAPSGGTQDEAAIALALGVEYVITLYRGTLASPVLAAIHAFTP